ncbi:response regulator [Marinoscillum pacificum]|uniref:response regulator n=1 Tax=Marinoscillum pacificum TaxID=392723 RepID=UPI0021587DA7|nr:response regulator [Marinoscillum pacificum]
MGESTKKILVVDDSESIREAIDMALTGAGYQVHKAIDGLDGVKTLGDKSFDLVITDLNMPNMDGISLVQEIRKNDKNKFLPVLILTTESQNAKRMEARNAGATGWIVKPFVKDQLIGVVKKVLR